ncbi:Zinc finger BED domain-containing protein 4 [Puccinia graminis f. sp. tritici]|uniref:Zinc finger BED domain-containing protein 4 n=1 Tax=Puccinia graminis f. sp. tritici TaxID=56615 RepID=A0A5B0PHY7_PUCGR|nr:Zinc finger BED domain-containing protein 4 [Puccinia graminis f. sp. tritici]
MPTKRRQRSPSKTPTIFDDVSNSNSDKVTIIETSGPSAAPKTKNSTQDQSSWVWQYFKTQTIAGKKWNVCQTSIVPNGTAICKQKITPDKQGSTKSMSNHLLNIHGIKKDNAPAAFKDLSKFLNNSQALVMVADVSTQWNSTFKMLERAYEIWETIRKFCERHSLTEKYDLSDSEWEKVRQLCDFLEPLFQVTKRMSKNHFPLMTLAAPVYTWIMEQLQKACSKYDSQELVPPSNLMITKIQEYFDIAVKKPVYLFSTLLDP